MKVQIKTKAVIAIEADADEVNELALQLTFLIGDGRGTDETKALLDALTDAGF